MPSSMFALPRSLPRLLYAAAALVAAGTSGLWFLGEEFPEARCELGNAEFCAEASLRAYRDKDAARYFEYATKACRGGFATGCSNVGVAYEQGLGVARDLVQALTHYRTACERDSAIACRNLGNMQLRGMGGPRDPALAKRYLRKACDAKSGQGCNDLARFQPRSEATKKVKLELYSKACEFGDLDGCSNLVDWLVSGPNPTASDLERAAALASENCALEHAGSCASFGNLLAHGFGTRQDPEAARQRLQFACEHGASNGCRQLGLMFDRGEGVVRNLARAEGLLERACALEDADACAYVAARLAQDWAPELTRESRAQRVAERQHRAESLNGENALLILPTE